MRQLLLEIRTEQANKNPKRPLGEFVFPSSGGTGQPAPKSVAPLPRPSPKFLTQQSMWRHLPQPVSDEELKLDKAKCALAGKTASSTGSPETKFNLVFAACMRSKGYESI